MNKRRKEQKKYAAELDEFQAYGEYSYEYRHEQKPAEEDREPVDFDDEEGHARYGNRRTEHIPLEKEAPRKKSHSVVARLIFLLVCAVVILIVLQGTVFRLNTVYVIGNITKTPQDITRLSGLVKGLNIFAINEDDIRQSLSQDHTIEFLRMQKEYPSSVYLYISERTSVAAMQQNGIQYTLDAQGLVMNESNSLILPEALPVVTGLQVTTIHVGQLLELKDEKQLFAYRAVMAELQLQFYADQISELNLSNPDNLYLMTIDGITVRLGSAEHPRAKIGALRTDMAYLRQLGKSSGILDVSIPEDAKYTPE